MTFLRSSGWHVGIGGRLDRRASSRGLFLPVSPTGAL